MGNNGRVVMGQGVALESEGVVSNAATVQARNEKLDSLNVDGQFIRPDWVAARGLSLGESLRVGEGVALTDGCVTAQYIGSDAVTTEKIYAGAVTATEMTISSLSSISANLGTITSGSIAIGSGGASIGDATAGVSISSNVIRCIKDGVATVQINGSDGSAYFNGEVVASKVTISSNAANSVDFGADVVINGNLIMQDTPGSTYIYLDQNSGSAALSFAVEDASHSNVMLQYSSNTIYGTVMLSALKSGTGCSASVGWEDMTLTIPAAAASVFSLKEGSTTVMSFAGNSTAVTFAGNVAVSNLTATDVHATSVTLEGGSVDPTIKAAAAPSEGDTSTEPLGSLRLSTGGSLWMTYLDGSTNKWTKVK